MEKAQKSKKGIGLSSQIFIALILGVVFGYIFPTYGQALKPIGDVFIRMIKMIVVPLVFSSLIMGIAGTGDFKKLGRLGGKAIIWFEIATTLALVVGLVVVNVLEPGAGVTVGSSLSGGAAAEAAKKTFDHVQMLVNLVPTNVVDAMARQDMLQIIVFSCFFGVAAAGIGAKGRPVIDISISIAEVMFKFTHYVMKLAPIGVFGSIAYTVGTYGLSMLLPLGKLILSLYLALIIFIALVLLGASLVVKVNFFHLMRALKEPLLLAFSTATSEAALPIAMEKLEEFGVHKHIVTFVLPMGYTFNLDGSTLYSALAVVFISQVYGVPFPLKF